MNGLKHLLARKLRLSLLSACLLLLSVCLLLVSAANQAFCAQPKAAEKTIQAIRIYQTHYFMGTEQITVAPDAVRIDNTAQLRFILISKAPDWKITVYRPDDKTYFTEDLKTFLDTGLLSDLLIGRKDPYSNDRPMRRSTMLLNGFKIERLTSPWTTTKFMKLDGIASPQVAKVLYSTYKLPTNGGIPLAYIGTHDRTDFITGMHVKGKREVNLETEKIEKVAVAPSFFALPTGLKKAASLRDVVSGTSNRKQSEEIDEMFHK